MLQGSEAALLATRELVAEHERRLEELGRTSSEATARCEAALAERSEQQAQLLTLTLTLTLPC